MNTPININKLIDLCYKRAHWPRPEESVLMEVISGITEAWKCAERGDDIGWFWIYPEGKSAYAVTAEASNIARAIMLLLDWAGYEKIKVENYDSGFDHCSSRQAIGKLITIKRLTQYYFSHSTREALRITIGRLLEYSRYKSWPIQDIISAVIKYDREGGDAKCNTR